MNRKQPLKRTALQASPDSTRAFVERGRASSARTLGKRRPVSPASPAQRAKVKGEPCLVCCEHSGVQPAHLISRAMCPEGADDPRAVVPLCALDHRDYDE